MICQQQEEYTQSINTSNLNEFCNFLTLDDIKEKAAQDPTYQKLIITIQSSFPANKQKTDSDLHTFWDVRDRLSTIDGIVYLDYRILIPSKLRKITLEHLHSAHQGTAKMKARASQTVYWPGMDKSIKNYSNTCSSCSKYAPSQQTEPLMLSPPLEWPFQQICMDYFSINNHTYLSIADRFSGWLCLYHFKHPRSNRAALIDICREYLDQLTNNLHIKEITILF